MSFDIKDYHRHPPNTTALLLETFHRKENCFIVAATFPRVKVTQTSSNCRWLLKVTRLPRPLCDRVLKTIHRLLSSLNYCPLNPQLARMHYLFFTNLFFFFLLPLHFHLFYFLSLYFTLPPSPCLRLWFFFPDLGKYLQDSPTQRESRVWPWGRWADTGSLLATPAGTRLWHAVTCCWRFTRLHLS